MAAQHSRYGDYSTRYKFNGKEQDQATGFYYYGARYYAPSLSRWLSTDPLAEKYQGFSPYNYTLNNPIMLVDPDGRRIKLSFRTGFLGIFGKKVTLTYDAKNKRWNNASGEQYTGKTSKFATSVLSDLKRNQKSTLGNKIVSTLSDVNMDYFIKRGSPDTNRTDNRKVYYNGADWNDEKVFENGKSGNSPGYVTLGHELAHKFSVLWGISNGKWFGSGTSKRGVDEYNAMFYENVLRFQNHLPLRVAYTVLDGSLKGIMIDASGNYKLPPKDLSDQKNSYTMPVFYKSLIMKSFPSISIFK